MLAAQTPGETAATEPERPVSPTRSEVGSDFWDPPCRVCKLVDNEPNVLCELCNGAYHLACIANIRPPLPRSPDDEEWFCRACIKRGVPEEIIDRVGRYSSAFYLVKWLGKPRWDVSWEDAATLDTPWSRRLIAASISSETDGSRASGRPLLPPCHPLVDLLPTLPSPDAAKAGDAAHVGGTGATPGTSASPAPAPAAGSAPAPAATGADARTHLPPGWSAMQKVSKSGKAYTRYVGPGGRVADSKPKAWAIAGAQEEGSAGAGAAGATGPKSHTPSRGQGASAACPPMAVLPSSVACGAAGQPGTPPATSSQLSSLERAAAKPGSYIGYLCYLREHRARLRAAAPGCTGKQLEKAAAEEWKSLPHEERAPVIQRARELMDQKLEAARGGADSDPRVVIGREGTGTGATGDRGGRAAVAASVNGRGRRACECCGELDQRDALRCNTCAARRHLMCFFPPLVGADAVPWVCEACTDAAMAGQQLRCVPAAGEEIEVEVSQPESAGGAGCWMPAVVRRQLAEGRFSAVIGGDEDFVEEFGVESEGEQWRRAMATIAELERRRAETQAARGDTLARRRREAEGARLDTEVQSAPLLDKVEQLYRDGLVIADGAITPQQVEASKEVVADGFARYMHCVKQLDLQEKLLDTGFMQIKMRSAGRYDLQLPELQTDDFAFLTRDAPWMPLVRAALGADAELTHLGCMLSFPGSATQPWHSDGPHMPSHGDERFVAPPHAVNVFVPLIDLHAGSGPTEYVPGSHRDFDRKAAVVTPSVLAGHALVFDYRLKHRGMANSGAAERPLLYLTYAKPFWLDVYNFDRKRYASLPEVAMHASRAERRQKRQKVLDGGVQ